MDNQKQQIIERLQQANNILVTVSNNPSVDQLTACIGLTLALNKMKKHATAVFSGAVPSIIEFLQPAKTLEKTTDSLRDFIIALDKAKADKLRYKVEDKFVKIFITPYRTSISQKDLEFSEGDFNVDVVLALGVHRQTDLDQAITAHGRILHDAAVISINTQPNVELGSVNLLEPQASSLSEIAVELLELLNKELIDDQIATALLTGIVAETDRFRNSRTTPATMSVSADLLAAGANQQLVAAKLDTPPPPPPRQPITPSQPSGSGSGDNTPPRPSKDKPDDGTLEIEHDEPASPLPKSVDDGTLDVPKAPQIHIDEEGRFRPIAEDKPAEPKMLPQPPPPLQSLPPQPPPPPLPAVNLPPLQGAPITDRDLAKFPSAPTDAPSGPLGMPPISPSVPTSLGSLPKPFQSPPLQSLPPLPPLPQPTSPPPPPMPQPSPPPPPPPPVPPEVIQPTVPPPSPPEPEPILPPPTQPPVIRTEGPHMMMRPPTFSSELTANAADQEEEPSGSAISLPQVETPGPILEREPLQMPSVGRAVAPPPNNSPSPLTLPPPPPPKGAPSPAPPVLGGGQTEPPLLAEESLTSLERDVKSPHLDYIEAPVPNNLPPPPPPTLPPPPPPNPVANKFPPFSNPLAPKQPDTPAPAANAANSEAVEQAAEIATARDALKVAYSEEPANNHSAEPYEAFNALPLGDPLHEDKPETPSAPPVDSSPLPPLPGTNNGIPPPPEVPPPFLPSPPPPSAG